MGADCRMESQCRRSLHITSCMRMSIRSIVTLSPMVRRFAKTAITKSTRKKAVTGVAPQGIDTTNWGNEHRRGPHLPRAVKFWRRGVKRFGRKSYKERARGRVRVGGCR